jgi:WD40 repeat protein
MGATMAVQRSFSMGYGPAHLFILFGLFILVSHGKAQDQPRLTIVPNIKNTAPADTLAFSPDGKYIVAPGGSNVFKLWETESGRLIRTFHGHVDEVTAAAFTPDGSRLISTSNDGTLKLWDLSGQAIRSIETGLSSTTFAAFAPDGSKAVSEGAHFGSDLKLVDVQTGQLIRLIKGGFKPTYKPFDATAFSPDGLRLLATANDKTVKLWDVGAGELIRSTKLPVKGPMPRWLAFSPDGTHAVFSMVIRDLYSKERTPYEELVIWNVANGQRVRGLPVESHTARFTPDGRQIVSGDRDGQLQFWDVETGQLKKTVKAHAAPIISLAFSPDGQRLLTNGGYADQDLKLWNVQTGELTRTLGANSAPVYDIAISASGAQLASAGAEGTVTMWDTTTGQLLRSIKTDTQGKFASIDLTRDASRLLVTGLEEIELRDTASGRLVRSIKTGREAIFKDAAFSPDGSRVISGSRDKTLKLWDAETGEPIRTYAGHTSFVEAVAFSPDGARLLSGGFDDHAVKLWDTKSGEMLRTLSGHSSFVGTVAFSTDGTRLLSGGVDKSIRLWDAASGSLIRTFDDPSIELWTTISSAEGTKAREPAGHSSSVLSVAFSADGKRVVSAGYEGTAKLWDAETGRLLHTLTGHTGGVKKAVFARDGKRVFSGSFDHTIRAWDVETGALLATLFATGGGEWVTLTPEGFFDASAKGAELLSIVRGLDVYGIDQFHQALYRPDLVREKLASDPNGKVKAAAAKLDLAKLLESGRAPRIMIASHPPHSASTLDGVTVEAQLNDQGGGIGRAEWRINGVTVGVVDKPARRDREPIKLKQTIALDPGENTIELTAYNGANLVASPAARITMKWTGIEPTVAPRLYVLVVGINDYLDAGLKLTYAVPDAKALAAALKQAGQGHYEDVHVTYVLDRDATVAGIDQVFTDLAAKVRPRDVFMFFAAGHGKTLDGRYYFVPYDLRYQTEQSLVGNAIDQDKLQEWFARVRAKKAVLMFDTCEAGSLTERPQARGLEQKAALGRLIQATGRATLTASTATQAAYEGYGGHGVFTFSILDALARADLNSNGMIELAELVQHVDGMVPAITEKRWGGKQYPQMDAYGANFPLARQVASLAPEPGDASVIPTKPTHVSTEPLQIFKEMGGNEGVAEPLPPFTTVTFVKSQNGWVLIAKEGKALGYVAEAKLHKLN